MQKRHKISLKKFCASVYTPERFPARLTAQVAPSVCGCKPHFSEHRPEPALLPESFCPLRRHNVCELSRFLHPIPIQFLKNGPTVSTFFSLAWINDRCQLSFLEYFIFFSPCTVCALSNPAEAADGGRPADGKEITTTLS